METQTISTLDAIKELAEKPAMTMVNGVPVLCLPPDWKAEDQTHLLPQPIHISEDVKFIDLQSFIDYINRFKQENRSIIQIEANQDGIHATARLDYHEPPSTPHWGMHTANFRTTNTPAWGAWVRSNNRSFKQSDFAAFLYENQQEIKTPTGAELLEIVETLKATAKGEFRDMRDLNTGSSELIYRLTVNAQGGTQEKPLSLPKQLKIRLMPFYGCPEMELTADLLLTVPREDGGPVQMAYRFYRLEDDLEDLFAAIQKEIADSTGLPVYR